MVMPEENEIIDTGEHTLEDLLDQGGDEEYKEEDDDWEIVRELFSPKKGGKKVKPPKVLGLKLLLL